MHLRVPNPVGWRSETARALPLSGTLDVRLVLGSHHKRAIWLVLLPLRQHLLLSDL